MNYWTQSKDNIFVAAHRGWMEKYPENTMSAFRAALELGVDQLETDVRITKDGELVLIHDATVDRTTNGTGKVCDYTLKELRTLDAGSGEKIPTLTEFMELVKDHPTLTIDLELKEYPLPGWEAVSYDVCDRVLKIVEKYGFADRMVINSWSGKLNEYIFRKYGKKYRQHTFYPPEKLGECELDPYSFAYCTCICGIHDGTTTVEEIRKLHRETGIRLWAGRRVNTEERIDLAVEMGVELITCNDPDVVLSILRKKNLHK